MLIIAILGATGHIAKNLIEGLSKNRQYNLILFARDQVHLSAFLSAHIKEQDKILVRKFDEFLIGHYDVVINCVGVGDPAKLKKMGGALFKLTESFDQLVLDYLQQDHDALYINFSSGAAYGSDFTEPADQGKSAIIDINRISPMDYYTITKINAEAKHRALADYNIIDLRIFGFFSRFIDGNTPFFLSELVNCIKFGNVFVTGDHDMARDYIHPMDLVQMIEKCIASPPINDVFDVFSLEAITKFQVIDYFIKHYHLQVSVTKEDLSQSPTGLKSYYYSLYKKSLTLGYCPMYKSIDAIASETKAILFG